MWNSVENNNPTSDLSAKKVSGENNNPTSDSSAKNVFGTIVDDQFVKKHPELLPEGTTEAVKAADKSYLAYRRKKIVENDDSYQDYVKKLQKIIDEQHCCDKSYTICKIYNATGSPLERSKGLKNCDSRAVDDNDFPDKIENGQLAVALYVGSFGRVLYKGENYNKKKFAVLYAWKNDPNKYDEHVLTTIAKAGYYDNENHLPSSCSLEKHEGPHDDDSKEFYSEAASIAEDKDVYIFSGIVILKWCFPRFLIN